MRDIPWDAIDEKIRPFVRVLNEAGFETFSSCEGHEDNGRGLAWVMFIPDGNVLEFVERLVPFLWDNGLAGATVSLGVNVTRTDRTHLPQVKVEWWRGRPYK